MDKKLGILGGGQLGRMLAASASLLNIPVIILDTGAHSPAKQILAPSSGATAHIDGSFTDPAKIRELAAKVDVLTVEIEHVDAQVLADVQRELGVEVHPAPRTIQIIQDKYAQKAHLAAAGCPLGAYAAVEATPAGVRAAVEALGMPLMLKSRTLAYDGRGNFVLRTLEQVDEALEFLGGRPLYAEKWVPFAREIAVMVVRARDGTVCAYPAVETVHKDNICHLVFAPLRVRERGVEKRAREVAERAVKTFEGAGVFGVEMFLLDNGDILINEIAPRPHNSGHYTIEACATSQYANHLRAVLGLPLGSTALTVPASAMLNLLGASDSLSDLQPAIDLALATPGAHVHLYGKEACRKGRKMGHITLVAPSDAALLDRLRPLLSALPGASPASTTLHAPPPPAPGHSHARPLVGIIMGSDSDLPIMLPAARVLDRFSIPYELSIVSAHRTPDRLVEYARSAAPRGLRVVVAGAGGAAHLPGMVAAMTALPVVGVPVKGSNLEGVDSLYSIVQMPRGVPVATVAINNGMNAGLLAVRILSAGDPALIEAMDKFLKEQEQEVLGKVEKLEEVGWEKYTVKK